MLKESSPRCLWLPVQVDFLINRLIAIEEHMKSTEEQIALELDHRSAPTRLIMLGLLSTLLAASWGASVVHPTLSHWRLTSQAT